MPKLSHDPRLNSEILADLAEVSRLLTQAADRLTRLIPKLAPLPTAEAPLGTPAYLTTKEAAALLGMSAGALSSLRARGGGPRHIRIGKLVRYPADALLELASR